MLSRNTQITCIAESVLAFARREHGVEAGGVRVGIWLGGGDGGVLGLLLGGVGGEGGLGL